MGGIDFLVIGSIRCGTTTLHEHLAAHPRVFLPAGKEVPFFSSEVMLDLGWDRYYSHHYPSNRTRGKVVGQVSPQYLTGSLYPSAQSLAVSTPEEAAALVPKGIAETLPDVKLIAILRDPVERAISHYRLAVLSNLESRSFDQMVAEELDQESLQVARLQPSRTNYVAIGEYARILKPYFDHFSSDQLLVLPFSLFEKNELELLGKVLEFIGLSADYKPDSLGKRFNAATERQRIPNLHTRFYAIRGRLAHFGSFRRVWHRLPPHARRRIDRSYRQISYRAFLWNRLEPQTGPDDHYSSLPSREALVEHFGDWRASLRPLLGRVPGVTEDDPAPASKDSSLVQPSSL